MSLSQTLNTESGAARRFAPTAENTYVVAVGIETYGADIASLTGPASDATRFLNWLIQTGKASRDRCVLFLSDLATERDLDLPVQVRPATGESIEKFLRDELPLKHGKLLIVYWCGHGLLYDDESRLLLYSEASRARPAGLNLSALLKLLRSDFFPADSWPQQIFLVDACATLINPAGFQPDDLPRARPVLERKQFTFFGSSRGYSAYNDKKAVGGFFSREVLSDLRDHANDVWPPDPGAMSARVVEKFRLLRAAGHPEQAPAYIWNTGWDGCERTFGDFMEPGAAAPAKPAPLRSFSQPLLAASARRLAACPAILDAANRRRLLRQLRREIAIHIPEANTAFDHAVNIIETCAGIPGGFEELVELVRFWNDDTLECARFLKIVS